MAPNLRSSAPNTPSKNSSDSPTVTPRKTPTCTKCKRPRAGHPRSGCPYADSPSNDHTGQTPPTATKNIADALGSMQISSPSRGRDEDTKATIRNRRRSSQPLAPAQTLMSLSSDSQEIVERLLQPGMFDDDTDGEHDVGDSGSKTRVIRWQETLVATPIKRKPKTKMPGSLHSPSPDTSMETTRASIQKAETPAPDNSIYTTNLNLASPHTQRPQPLVRSMSLKQRDMFVSSLTKASDATVYVVPSDDIKSVQASAIELGFFARIVINKDINDPQGLLILGRDEKAVQRLFEKVEVERKKASTGRLRAAAGGAVVGVVSTWAGLALA